MAVVGIVAEYNPFHKGHQYQVQEVRRQLGDHCGIVCAMSGNWVQRGSAAITDKWTRAQMAVEGGADLVLELPTTWAMASAERFAQGAIEVLRGTGIVDTLSFGCELGQGEALRLVADCLNGEDYRVALRPFLEEGLPFATCRHRAVAKILGTETAGVLATPNNNLAVEYLRCAPKDWAILPIARVGVDHDGGEGEGYASASQLRSWIGQGKLGRSLPYMTAEFDGDIASMEWVERAILAKLRTMTQAEVEGHPDSGEGLAVRLLATAGEAQTLEEIYDLTKTKRYAHARIRRLVLSAFLGLSRENRPEKVPYLRVLAFNQRGQGLLSEMKGTAALPILTKPAHVRQLDEGAQKCFAIENRCTDLYGLCFDRIKPAGWEWRETPRVVKSEE